MLAVVAIVTREAFVLAIALPFAATGYFMWYQATGRMRKRVAEGVNADGSRFAEQKAREGSQRTRSRFAREARERINRERRRQARATGGRARASAAGGAGTAGGRRRRRVRRDDGPTLEEAYRRLDVEPGAGEDAIRKAYRERVKEVHPDTASGDEEAFKRVTAAYERLTDD
jgi:DnaJ-domain-containing protein 1